MSDPAADPGRAYRRALGAFATGVCVVTAPVAKGAIGITVNSFTSVSLHPRLILWCLGAASEHYALFAEAERWGVSVLGAGQGGLALRFAGELDRRLEPDGVATLAEDGGPVLLDALARFACRTHSRQMMGDHLVIAGEVIAFDVAAGDGLTYFRSRFGVAPEDLD